jgi:hypothetical protein
VKNDRTMSPLLPTFSVKENGHSIPQKRLTSNPLYRSNFTAFAKLLTPPSDHHHM